MLKNQLKKYRLANSSYHMAINSLIFLIFSILLIVILDKLNISKSDTLAGILFFTPFGFFVILSARWIFFEKKFYKFFFELTKSIQKVNCNYCKWETKPVNQETSWEKVAKLIDEASYPNPCPRNTNGKLVHVCTIECEIQKHDDLIFFAEFYSEASKKGNIDYVLLYFAKGRKKNVVLLNNTNYFESTVRRYIKKFMEY